MEINDVRDYVQQFVDDYLYNWLDEDEVRNISYLLADHARLQALAVCCMAIDSYSREEIAEMAKGVQP